MKTIFKSAVAGAVALAWVLCLSSGAEARGGRGGGGHAGGARPSMGRVGGGGGRPSMGHAGGGAAHRPAPRPQTGGGSRPSMGHVSRPATGGANRPSLGGAGGFSPSGGRPSLPGGRPEGGLSGNRPSPGNRPGGGERPGFGGDRPNLGGDRPSLGGINRPGPGGDRPTIGGDRPGGNRPGPGGDRPVIGGGDRPGRPGAGDRPIIGGGDRPGRPGAGGDRPIIGGGDRPGRPGGNINIGNNVNIGSGNIGSGNIAGNRPGWDRPNWNRPDWGWGGGGWAGNWHNHCINPHYGWYNGCWGGYWGSNWYAPLAWGAVGWGLGSLTSGWGYGTSYYNPYYVDSGAAPYDYSQPVVVNYVSADAGDATAQATPAPQEEPANEQATKLFDEGLALFKSTDYQGALAKFNAALEKLPGDPVVHEVRAVTLFALGDYKQSAAALNSFLSSAPGMDWTTMSSLYGSTDEYQTQLRKLEQHCRTNPTDASAAFVLAYQYLVLGDKDAAVKALQAVVRNQPQDYVAKRMLDALAPAETAPAAAPAPAPAPDGTAAPETDLVGTWQAKAGSTTIDLTITGDSQFTWKATDGGRPAANLSGQLTSSSDQIVLASQDHGSMSGSVKSLGPDKWQFAMSGAPPSDPGLSFVRVAN